MFYWGLAIGVIIVAALILGLVGGHRALKEEDLEYRDYDQY